MDIDFAEYQKYRRDLEYLDYKSEITGIYKNVEYTIFRIEQGNLLGYIRLKHGHQINFNQIKRVHGKHIILNNINGYDIIGFNTNEPGDLKLPYGSIGVYRDIFFVKNKLLELIDQII